MKYVGQIRCDYLADSWMLPNSLQEEFCETYAPKAA